MARKKHKKTHHRRRRVGAAGGAGIQGLLGNVVGAIAARYVVTKVATTVDSKIKGAALIGIGYIGSSKVKSPLLKAVCQGLAIGGATSVATSMGLIGATPIYPRLPGRNLPMIGQPGNGVRQMINGVTKHAVKDAAFG